MPKGPKSEKAKPKPKLSDKEQSERFKQTARELEVDESGEAFEKATEAILAKRPRTVER